MRTLTALAATALTIALAAAPAAAAGPTPIAHRGAGGTGIENTVEAFSTTSATTWEADLRWSADGVPVLLHDVDLGVFGCPAVQIAAVSAVRAAQCGPLARLANVVTLLQERPGTRLWLELKTPPTAVQWTVLEARLAPVKSRVVIEAFGPIRLEKASKRGFETAFLTRTPATTLPAGTDWYASEWKALTDGQVLALHLAGLKVAAWTPDRADWPRGVDAVITNQP